MACKEEKLASIREANSKGEASTTADQQKKLHDKLDKCKQESEKVRMSLAARAIENPKELLRPAVRQNREIRVDLTGKCYVTT